MSIGPLPNVSGNLSAAEDSSNLGYSSADDTGGASEDNGGNSASAAPSSTQ